eukprot:SAG31_NODE_2432_length_5706_cov_41.121634_2_plen_134_part_00
MQPWQDGRNVEEHGIKEAREAKVCRNNEKDYSPGPGPSKGSYTNLVREVYAVGYVPKESLALLMDWVTRKFQHKKLYLARRHMSEFVALLKSLDGEAKIGLSTAGLDAGKPFSTAKTRWRSHLGDDDYAKLNF